MVRQRHSLGSFGALVAALGLAVGGVACGADDDGSTAQSATSQMVDPASPDDEWVQVGGPVVMIQLPFLSDAANAIARAEGWFDEFGVDLEVEHVRSASALMPTVATGDVDVVFSGATPGLFMLMAAGERLAGVAGGSVLDPDGCTHVGTVALPTMLEQRDFDDPESLRGLRIGTTTVSMAPNQYVEEMVAGWGLTLDDVEIVEVEREAQPAVLGQGGVDVMVAQEPWATTMKSELGAVEVNAAHDVVPNQVNSLLVFGGRLLDDRELGARVLAAYLLGEAQYGNGPTDRNVEIMTDITGLDPDLLRSMCWTTLASDGRSIEGEVQDLLAYGLAAGEVETVPTSEQIWDHELRDEALEFLDERGLLHLVED